MKTEEMYNEISNRLVAINESVIEGREYRLDGLLEMRKAKVFAENLLATVKLYETEQHTNIVADSERYGGIYKGFEIKSVSGKKTFSYKNIEKVQEIEQKRKEVEERYKSALLGVEKGIVQSVNIDGVMHWIDENGEAQKFPEFTISKGYITIKEVKN